MEETFFIYLLILLFLSGSFFFFVFPLFPSFFSDPPQLFNAATMSILLPPLSSSFTCGTSWTRFLRSDWPFDNISLRCVCWWPDIPSVAASLPWPRAGRAGRAGRTRHRNCFKRLCIRNRADVFDPHRFFIDFNLSFLGRVLDLIRNWWKNKFINE